jgi:hypothetical protein
MVPKEKSCFKLALHGAHEAYARQYQGTQDMLKCCAQNDSAIDKKVIVHGNARVDCASHLTSVC